jgi:hypothetical protein
MEKKNKENRMQEFPELSTTYEQRFPSTGRNLKGLTLSEQ